MALRTFPLEREGKHSLSKHTINDVSSNRLVFMHIVRYTTPLITFLNAGSEEKGEQE